MDQNSKADFAPPSHGTIIKEFSNNKMGHVRKKKSEIDNIILDIWYILIAFIYIYIYIYIIDSKYLFQFLSPQSKNIFQNIIYLYNRI